MRFFPTGRSMLPLGSFVFCLFRSCSVGLLVGSVLVFSRSELAVNGRECRAGVCVSRIHPIRSSYCLSIDKGRKTKDDGRRGEDRKIGR